MFIRTNKYSPGLAITFWVPYLALTLPVQTQQTIRRYTIFLFYNHYHEGKVIATRRIKYIMPAQFTARTGMAEQFIVSLHEAEVLFKQRNTIRTIRKKVNTLSVRSKEVY